MRFADQVVLVTGGSRGLGAVLAQRFAAEGATVAVHCRVQAGKAEQVVAGIRAAGGSASAHAADLTDAAALLHLVDEVTGQHGRIDVLVNNAALGRAHPFAIDDPAAWAEVIQANLVGAGLLTRAVVRGMIGRGRGAVVNVASVAALRATPSQSAYAASKGGLIALTRALGAELAPRGIRVNAVVPGLLDVGMAARMPREQRDRWVEGIPAGRTGTADEVADAVLFLASDAARYVVGHALVVDGGLSL